MKSNEKNKKRLTKAEALVLENEDKAKIKEALSDVKERNGKCSEDVSKIQAELKKIAPDLFLMLDILRQFFFFLLNFVFVYLLKL